MTHIELAPGEINMILAGLESVILDLHNVIVTCPYPDEEAAALAQIQVTKERYEALRDRLFREAIG